MYYPTLNEIRQLREVERGNKEDTRKPLLPICYDPLADMETPVSAYCKTARGPYSFLLESVAGGELSKICRGGGSVDVGRGRLRRPGCFTRSPTRATQASPPLQFFEGP